MKRFTAVNFSGEVRSGAETSAILLITHKVACKNVLQFYNHKPLGAEISLSLQYIFYSEIEPKTGVLYLGWKFGYMSLSFVTSEMCCQTHLSSLLYSISVYFHFVIQQYLRVCS